MLQYFRAKKHNINKIMRYRHLDSAGIISIIKLNARDTAPTIRANASVGKNRSNPLSINQTEKILVHMIRKPVVKQITK